MALRSLQATAGNAVVCELMRASGGVQAATPASSSRSLQRRISIAGAPAISVDDLVRELTAIHADERVIELLSRWAGDSVPRQYPQLTDAVRAAELELATRGRGGPSQPPGARHQVRTPVSPPTAFGPSHTITTSPGASTQATGSSTHDVPSEPVRSQPPPVPPRRRQQDVGSEGAKAAPRPGPPPGLPPVVEPQRVPLRTMPVPLPVPRLRTAPPPIGLAHTAPQVTPQPQGPTPSPAPRRPPPPIPQRVGGGARALRTDIPRAVAADLQEAYLAYQQHKFTTHGEFYERWYKQSLVKSGAKPNETQTRQYAELEQRHLPDLVEKRSEGGYKFLHQEDATPTTRVYLNTVPGAAAEVASVVRRLAEQFKGYIGSKIGDAQVAYMGRDVVVIYLNRETDADTVRAILGRYHAANEEKFVHEVPRFTQPVLKGVSLGAEPPTQQLASAFEARSSVPGFAWDSEKGEESEGDVHLAADFVENPFPLSFSTYRAQLIFEALVSTRDQDTYDRRVVENLALGGIDARAPFLQGEPAALILYRLGLVYRTFRISLPVPSPQGKLPKTVEHDGATWNVEDPIGARGGATTTCLISRTERVPEPAPLGH
jgi:hypothetical protein